MKRGYVIDSIIPYTASGQTSQLKIMQGTRRVAPPGKLATMQERLKTELVPIKVDEDGKIIVTLELYIGLGKTNIEITLRPEN